MGIGKPRHRQWKPLGGLDLILNEGEPNAHFLLLGAEVIIAATKQLPAMVRPAKT